MDENSTNVVRSLPINEEKYTVLRSPLRKVLSPINANINRNPSDGFSYTDQSYPFLLEAKTPKTPSIFACASNGFSKTPLDKYNAQSSNLKVGSENILTS